MAGLNLMGGAQVGVGPQSSGGVTATATAAAFGTAAKPDAGVSALAPNDAGGIGFWWSVVSVGVLLFLYYTLPE